MQAAPFFAGAVTSCGIGRGRTPADGAQAQEARGGPNSGGTVFSALPCGSRYPSMGLRRRRSAKVTDSGGYGGFFKSEKIRAVFRCQNGTNSTQAFIL